MAFKSLLDPTFTYRNAANTDVRLTFDRIRRELRARRLAEQDAAEPVKLVLNPQRVPQGPRLGT
jgi:hypothetical protein